MLRQRMHRIASELPDYKLPGVFWADSDMAHDALWLPRLLGPQHVEERGIKRLRWNDARDKRAAPRMPVRGFIPTINAITSPSDPLLSIEQILWGH